MKLFRIITVAFLFNIARASVIDECIHCIKTKKIFVRNLYSWSRREYACINTTEILEKEAYLPLFRACAIPHCLCIDSVIKNLSTLNLCREKSRYTCDCDEICTMHIQQFSESSSNCLENYKIVTILRFFLTLVCVLILSSGYI